MEAQQALRPSLVELDPGCCMVATALTSTVATGIEAKSFLAGAR